MSSSRNVVFIAAGAAAIACVAYLAGRRSGVDGNADARSDGGSPPSVLPHTSASAAPVASAGAEGGAANAASSGDPLMPLGSPNTAADLFTRLQKEKDTRLKLEPTAESVFAAIKKKAGVQVDQELQVAGFVVGAKYCDKVRTKKDVHVVVCEFDDEASAIKGVTYGDNQAIKGREVLRNKTSTCAVYAADEKTGGAEAAKIKDIFKAM
jgi:hypothetical protein